MRGVFLDRGSVGGDLDFRLLEASLEDWSWFEHTPPGQTAHRLADAEVVVTNKVVLNERVLADSPALGLICVAATGTDNVDLAAARRRGIPVCNVTGYATASVVEHVFALMLALTRRLTETQALVHGGAWQRADQFCLLQLPMGELAGRSLGIVGYGELGRNVARVAEAFGMDVLLAQRPGGDDRPGRLPLPALLARVDVLSLHCPLTEQTKGLIGAAELQAMKPTALLINAARGGLVDERALMRALLAGRLGGAGIDVLAEEPPVHGSPLLETPLPNLIVTPHVAWASRPARQRLLDEIAANIRAYRAGTARNIVA
jgi:glycerate dehydrogenase